LELQTGLYTRAFELLLLLNVTATLD